MTGTYGNWGTFIDAQARRIKLAPIYTQTFTKRDAVNPRNVLTLPVEPYAIDPGAYYHGTVYGYKSKGCRCEKCQRANADIGRHFRQQRARRYTDRTPQPSLFQEQGSV